MASRRFPRWAGCAAHLGAGEGQETEGLCSEPEPLKPGWKTPPWRIPSFPPSSQGLPSFLLLLGRQSGSGLPAPSFAHPLFFCATPSFWKPGCSPSARGSRNPLHPKVSFAPFAPPSAPRHKLVSAELQGSWALGTNPCVLKTEALACHTEKEQPRSSEFPSEAHTKAPFAGLTLKAVPEVHYYYVHCTRKKVSQKHDLDRPGTGSKILQRQGPFYKFLCFSF